MSKPGAQYADAIDRVIDEAEVLVLSERLFT
jgi:hypothetical protein